MSKQNGNKGRRFDRAFKEEAVRLLQTSGRRQRQIAGDLGISVSALGRWVTELREEDLLSGPHEDAAKEITCAAWRPDTVGYRDPVVATKLSLKSLARRILDINDEIAELDRFIVPLVEELAPSLLELEGVGTENAGAVMVAVGDNPDRLRSEASFAMMCGVCPIPASSGKDDNATVSTAEATAKPTQPCTWSSCAECEPTSGPEPMSLAGPWRGCPNARSCAA